MNFTRRPQRSDGHVEFSLGSMGELTRDAAEKEIGLIARDAGLPDYPNPAQLYEVIVGYLDGTQGRQLGGFSVPAEIADRVQAGLRKKGHTVE